MALQHSREGNGQLKSAIANLNEEFQTIFWMRHVEQKTPVEISVTLKIPQKQVIRIAALVLTIVRSTLGDAETIRLLPHSFKVPKKACACGCGVTLYGSTKQYIEGHDIEGFKPDLNFPKPKRPPRTRPEPAGIEETIKMVTAVIEKFPKIHRSIFWAHYRERTAYWKIAMAFGLSLKDTRFISRMVMENVIDCLGYEPVLALTYEGKEKTSAVGGNW